MASPVEPGYSRGTLPNFSSLPCFNVKWGRRKHLRCVKHSDDDDHHEFATSLTPPECNSDDYHHNRKRRRSIDDIHDGGIQAIREKLMIDFRRKVDLIQADFLKKSDVVSTVAQSLKSEAAAEARPWNLRTRRAICKEPNNVPLSSDRRPSFFPARFTETKSPMKRNVENDGGGADGNGARERFSGSLSKQEIEEDFLAIMGIRPPRRPKKRPKIVQKQINAFLPGFWLSEITVDMYKVNHNP